MPAVEDGWFLVDGPAGFDLLYFVVSPKPIDIASGEGDKGMRRELLDAGFAQAALQRCHLPGAGGMRG